MRRDLTRWIKRLLPLLPIAVCSVGCSLDYDTGFYRANEAVRAFLIGYARTQVDNRNRDHRYQTSLTPTGGSGDWLTLAPAYALVNKVGYTCRFEVHDVHYDVSCAPKASSGLKISFYLDETLLIRLSGEAPAGPGSLVVRLSSAEKRRLYGDVGSAK
jgi:hypothetical protein